MVCLLAAPPLLRAKLETWRQDSSATFGKGKRDRVVLAESGRVRLGQSLKPLAKLEAMRVWDLARTSKGAIYAATGDSGKVYRHEGPDEAAWTLAFDSTDTQVLSLAALPDGRVFAGTGSSGQVVEVTDPKHPASRPDPGVQYVWDLAADAHGNLFAATGPTGQLWKRSAEGKWSLVLDSKHPHLLCVVVGPDGTIHAGSDGEGLIYRVGPDGKVAIVYDAPQNEIHTLLLGPDGALYAGTAAEAGGGSGRGGSPIFSGGAPALSARATNSGTLVAAAADPVKPGEPPARPTPAAPFSSGGSATPRPTAAGDNVVYRIDADSAPREIFRAKALIYALAWQGDRLLVGTGPEGLLYEVRRKANNESSPIARLDNGQVLALLTEPEGGLLAGTGDPAAVVRLAPGFVAEGTLTSDVLDTKLISRFGALTWRADRPAGTSVAFQVRSGNVAEPDETWSVWSAEQTDPDASKALTPPGRFVQYRAKLATTEPTTTPELRSVALRYQSMNLPPEISRVEVPDLSAGDGATRQTRLTVRWDVTDPNDDDLSATLHIRKEGWPTWVPLGDGPLTDKTYAWDTTAVPAGTYRVRVTATDRPSNGPDDALTRNRVSDPFIVDHEAPKVAIVATSPPRGATVTLKDNLTRLVKAAYAIDGGDWVPVFPADGLFDTLTETLVIALPDLKAGLHVLVVRAIDAAGNVGTGDALIGTTP